MKQYKFRYNTYIPIHTHQYIHTNTYTPIHTHPYIHNNTYTTIHTQQNIHNNTYTTIHTQQYIHNNTYTTNALLLQVSIVLFQLGVFTGAHFTKPVLLSQLVMYVTRVPVWRELSRAQ